MKHKKGAFFTDIHFGKKGNSEVHNGDCIRFIKWFIHQVKQDPEIDYIGFLGDWHENRSALNVSTLNYSYEGAKLLSELGLPVYFLIGNHDLYRRHSREVHSVPQMEELENFNMITEPTVVGDIMFAPFMFPHEYPELQKYKDIPYWAGHFEFKGFLITGYGITMPTGPDPKDYQKQKRIFSGHFHKRQWGGNVVYMGNAFPMDFSDADDTNRGMMVFEHEPNEVTFIDWPDCPKYIKTTLSDILDELVDLPEYSTVECTVDEELDFKESAHLREMFIKQYKLRDIKLEEQHDPEVLSEATIDVDDSKMSTNDLVIEMLRGIETDKLDKDLLVQVYTNIPDA